MSYTDGMIQWYESLILLLLYCVYVGVCVFGNWYYRKKYPEKYIRGPDGKFLRQQSYFLKDILDQSKPTGDINNAFQSTEDIQPRFVTRLFAQKFCVQKFQNPKKIKKIQKKIK